MEGSRHLRWRAWSVILPLLAVLTLLAVGLAACGSASAEPSSTDTPVAIATGPVASPTPGPALSCTVHTSAGEEDDSQQMALSCAVARAPAGDTSYVLHYGVNDPSGLFHAFSQTCAGTLHNGAGTCGQTYEYIFPFPAQPGPVTGQFSPSGLRFGPAIPVSA